jgi:hypothetical protein
MRFSLGDAKLFLFPSSDKEVPNLLCSFAVSYILLHCLFFALIYVTVFMFSTVILVKVVKLID